MSFENLLKCSRIFENFSTASNEPQFYPCSGHVKMENVSHEQLPLDQSEFVLTVDLFRILFIAFGLISNTILFILLFKYSLLSTHANLFLLNLALTDVISLLYDSFIIISRHAQIYSVFIYQILCSFS